MVGQPQPRGNNGRLHWQAALVAAAAITIVNLFVLTWVTHKGWLAGSAFPRPLGSRLLVYASLNLAFVVGPLALSQWLRHRSRALAIGSYLVIVFAFSMGSIPVLQGFLARGIFIFAGPYSVAWDVAWGAAQYLLAFGLCKFFSGVMRGR